MGQEIPGVTTEWKQVSPGTDNPYDPPTPSPNPNPDPDTPVDPDTNTNTDPDTNTNPDVESAPTSPLLPPGSLVPRRPGHEGLPQDVELLVRLPLPCDRAPGRPDPRPPPVPLRRLPDGRRSVSRAAGAPRVARGHRRAQTCGQRPVSSLEH